MKTLLSITALAVSALLAPPAAHASNECEDDTISSVDVFALDAFSIDFQAALEAGVPLAPTERLFCRALDGSQCTVQGAPAPVTSHDSAQSLKVVPTPIPARRVHVTWHSVEPIVSTLPPAEGTHCRLDRPPRAH